MCEVGYNYRITDFQCAMGSSQLKKLDRFVERRREIARFYDKALSPVDFIKIPESNSSVDHAYHLYPLQIDFAKTDVIKSDLFKKMKVFDINLQVHYIPVHLQPFYQRNYGFKSGDFPITEQYYKEAISIPMFYGLKEDDQSYVISTLREILRP